jgi:nitroreductase
VAAVPLEVVSAAVQAGIQAPSGDNCQPWRFRWDGECLRILFLPERAESLYDIRSAASWISLGAVIANVTLAAAQAGFALTVDLFPTGELPGAVTRIRFHAGAVSADPLAEAIATRCVNRRPYRAEPLPFGVREELQGLATTAGARLSWIETEPAKRRVAALAAENDRILFENRALHDGLYRWIRWSPAEAERRRDGMPAAALELAAIERPGMRILGSWRWARLAAGLGITRGLPLRARAIYRRSAAIALLSVRGDGPEDFVRGGEVLERIWLSATRHGMAFQPITGITFLLLRRRLTDGEGLSAPHRALLDRVDSEFKRLYPESAGESPIMLFRLGMSPSPSGRSPRLRLEQVFEVSPSVSSHPPPPREARE